MRRIRTMGLCLGVAFAMSAVAAASASAAFPEYFSGGKPLGATTKVAFTGKGQGVSHLGGAVIIECTSDVSKGTIEGPKKTVKVVLTYKGCSAPSITSSCQTSSKVPGQIKTKLLHSELVFASEATSGALVAAQKYTPEKPPTETEIKEGFTTGLFASFSCGPLKELKVKVSGTIFTEVTADKEALTGEAINGEKAEIFGCGKQKLLFENATGTCKHLFTKSGAAWNVQKDTVTYPKLLEVKTK
jgi:hypothetical protein